MGNLGGTWIVYLSRTLFTSVAILFLFIVLRDCLARFWRDILDAACIAHGFRRILFIFFSYLFSNPRTKQVVNDELLDNLDETTDYPVEGYGCW